MSLNRARQHWHTRRYGTGSGSDRAPAERALRRAPGRYRSRYRTNVTWFDLVLRTAIKRAKAKRAKSGKKFFFALFALFALFASLSFASKVTSSRYLNALAPLFSPQAYSQTQEQQTQGGASTAGAFKPVKDSSARPITAGGFVDGAPVYFADVTARAGLQKFRHVSGVADKHYILESPSAAWRSSITTTTDGSIFTWSTARPLPLCKAKKNRRAPRSIATTVTAHLLM